MFKESSSCMRFFVTAKSMVSFLKWISQENAYNAQCANSVAE